MTTTELQRLAEWLLGPNAKPHSVVAMMGWWQKNPGAAQRWAEVRDREKAAKAAKEGAR